jgi:tRNA(fMet)-specific endonuclease VapC
LLDTNVVIHLRNDDRAVSERFTARDGALLRPIVSRVELGGGDYRDPAQAASRRPRLDAMLGSIPVLAYDDLAADAYRRIKQTAGYSRRNCWTG